MGGGLLFFWGGAAAAQQGSTCRLHLVRCRPTAVELFSFNLSTHEPPHMQNDTITINRRQAADHQVGWGEGAGGGAGGQVGQGAGGATPLGILHILTAFTA
jgi:hypothetical protein